MDHRFRKVEVRIKGIIVPILNLNLRSVYEMREEFEISYKKQTDLITGFGTSENADEMARYCNLEICKEVSGIFVTPIWNFLLPYQSLSYDSNQAAIFLTIVLYTSAGRTIFTYQTVLIAGRLPEMVF